MPRELYVRRPLTLLPPLAKRAQTYTEVFGGLTFVRVSIEVGNALALLLGCALLVLFWHRRSPFLPLSALKGIRRAGSRRKLARFCRAKLKFA